jgi:SAM-dependent methyltransferase
MNGANSVTLSVAATAFDRVADSYDDLFTRTAIGRAQRRQVWSRLLTAFQPGDRILELNCGTGEDARFLAQRGVCVVACDASSVMIEAARRRNQMEGMLANAEYLHLANEDLEHLKGQPLFDGAFSNFSGLNCLADLTPVAHNLADLVKPGRPVLICLWSRVCVSEILWYLLRGQPARAFRRFSEKPAATVAGIKFSVSYPTVRGVRRVFAPAFELNWRRAVGLFVPPSYVEPWMSRHGKTLTGLEWLDRICAEWPVFRDVGDHVLLEFVRCKP